MIRKLTALSCLLVLVLACEQGRDGQDTGAVPGAGSESGTLPADTGYTGAGIEDTTADTSAPAADTAPAGETGGAPSDTTSAGGEGAAGETGSDTTTQ